MTNDDQITFQKKEDAVVFSELKNGISGLKFEKLSHICRTQFNSTIEKIPPYSCFNWLSLQCCFPDALVSFIPHGLILFLKDPITGEKYFSPLLHDSNEEIFRGLISEATNMSADSKLRYIPEESLEGLNGDFKIEPRRDAFDYIFSIEDMLNPSCSSVTVNHESANDCRANNTGIRVEQVEYSPKIASSFADFIRSRSKAGKNCTYKDTLEWDNYNLLRCLDIWKNHYFSVFSAFDQKGNVIGFTINEISNDDIFIGHFGRAQRKFVGLSELLEIETAKAMQDIGLKYLNDQEDLGNSYLREKKSSWKPTRHLRVFDICL